MVKYGMPTLIECPDPAESAKLCQALGLSFVELNMNLPQYQIAPMEQAGLARIAREYGISYTIHLDDNLNVGDFNPAVAAAYEQTVLDGVAMAQRLEIPLLNMHLHKGAVFTLPEKKVYVFEAYRDAYLRRMEEFRNRCQAAIGGSGVKICVENIGGYAPWQIETLDVLLESDAFGLTLDVGHNYCSGGTDEPVILERSSRLRHIHLHDARLPSQDHLALGDGELDIDGYLKMAAEHQCSVVLETKTIAGLRASAEWIRQHG